MGKTINSPYLTLCLAIGFIALAWYSLPTQGYTKHDLAQMDRLVAEAVPASLKQRQAAAIADVWGLTADDVAKPVILWGN